MMMHRSLSHSQRYSRAKGMKVKHLMQLVTLTVLFTWFSYQVNISYKAKVLSLHAEDVIGDELLISDDKGEFIRHGVNHEDITAEEFIDKQWVLRSRKLLPDAATDTPEFEQNITEADRFEDVLHAEHVDDLGILNDLGERDIDSSDDGVVRRTVEAKGGKETGRVVVEGHNKALSNRRGTETAEDGEDGEDEVAEVRTEFEAVLDATSFTETAEDDALVYISSEEIKVKDVDVSSAEGNTLTNRIPTNNSDDDIPNQEIQLVAGPESSEQQRVLKKNPTKQDDGATDQLEAGDEIKSSGIAATEELSKEPEAGKNLLQNGAVITSSSAEKVGSKSDKVAVVKTGHSKESNVTGEIDPGSAHEFKEDEMGYGPVPLLRNGADAEALQEGGRDAHENVAFHGNGHDERNGKQDDQPVQEEAIVEVVSMAKQRNN